MKNSIWNVILLVPILAVSVHSSLANWDMNPITPKLTPPTVNLGVNIPGLTSIANLQPNQINYVLAARGDDDDEKCRWLGKCLG